MSNTSDSTCEAAVAYSSPVILKLNHANASLCRWYKRFRNKALSEYSDASRPMETRAFNSGESSCSTRRSSSRSGTNDHSKERTSPTESATWIGLISFNQIDEERMVFGLSMCFANHGPPHRFAASAIAVSVVSSVIATPCHVTCALTNTPFSDGLG